MEVHKHVLRDVSTPLPGAAAALGYRDFVANDDWRRNRIAFTSVLWHPQRKRVVCGLTSFETDLMYEFDPATRQFHSLDYPSVSETFEIKIHRSLCLMEDGSVLGATACLHREDQRAEAPGGRIFRYDFDGRRYDHLGIPVPHDYIQTITLDEPRGLVYGFSYPVFNFFVFDLRQRRTRRSDYVGSICHIAAIDDAGCIWSTWNNRTHNLFKYDPDADKITFYHHNLPYTQESVNLMYPGAGPIDMMLKGPDGFLYVGQADGTLLRLDPTTAQAEPIGKPQPERTRIPAMAIGPDGRIYGIAGYRGRCVLFAYETASQKFEILGKLEDSATGTAVYIGHDLCFGEDGWLFLGETDTKERASYLWQCRL